MAKSKWSELKKDMGESLVKATGGRTRKRLWRVEEKPSELRTSSIVERALQESDPFAYVERLGIKLTAEQAAELTAAIAAKD
jgi:hypothetical protein